MEPVKIGDQKHLNILLVEDNKVNQIFTLGLLRNLGYKCDLASDGKLAVEAVETKNYDLILMDCQLPVMDGYTAASIIKKRVGAKTILVANTAHTSEREMLRCKEAGMQFVLAKPTSIDSLKDILIQVYGCLHSI